MIQMVQNKDRDMTAELWQILDFTSLFHSVLTPLQAISLERGCLADKITKLMTALNGFTISNVNSTMQQSREVVSVCMNTYYQYISQPTVGLLHHHHHHPVG